MKNEKKGLKLIEAAKKIEAGNYTLKEAISFAQEVVGEGSIYNDLAEKKNVKGVVWTLTQTGMKTMGMGVI